MIELYLIRDARAIGSANFDHVVDARVMIDYAGHMTTTYGLQVSNPGSMTDGAILVAWSRPVINGKTQRLAVVGWDGPPITWATRAAAEKNADKIDGFNMKVIELP